MNPARRRPQYLDMFLLMHLDDPALASVQDTWRSWRLLVALVLLIVLLIGLGLTAVIR